MVVDRGQVSLRSAQDTDRLFAYEVKRAALRAYVELQWGWDEAVQVDFHRRDWKERRPEIVCVDGRDIGTIEVWRRVGDFHLGELYLLPKWQRQGIGSHLMTKLCAEADAKQVPVRLEVMKINPVRSFYERFGFGVTGETETHFRMERAPRTT